MELKNSMILGIKLKNFKSYRDEAEFSFYALSNNELSGNYTDIPLLGGGDVRILHSAVILGPNASGKSNVIWAFRALNYLVRQSRNFERNLKISAYESFMFDEQTENLPVSISVDLLIKGRKYSYEIEYRGLRCLIGRIREMNYIPGFQKKQHHLFASTLSGRLQKALVNAAWLRQLNPSLPIYERNPYTDVDRLVLYLLDNPMRYEWCRIGEIFHFMDCNIVININNDELLIAYDETKSLVINTSMLMYCSEDGVPLSPVLTGNMAFTPGTSEKTVAIDKRWHYLLLIELTKSKEERRIMVELPFFISEGDESVTSVKSV